MSAAALASGCVGVPFATPPLQLTLGTGVQASTDPPRLAPPLQARLGAHPLGFFSEQLARRVDFALGYLLDYSAIDLLHGGYGELGVVLLQTPLGKGFGRLGARLQGRLLARRAAGLVGGGGAVQVTWEYAWFNDGSVFGPEPGDRSRGGGAFGIAFGETALGAYVEGAVHAVGPVGWSASAGVLVRMPAMVGFAWAFLR